MKRMIAIFLAFLLCTGTVSAEVSVSKTAEYLQNAVQNPEISSIGGDWTVFGLAQNGEDVPAEYFQTYYQNAEKQILEKQGVLHARKYTEYARVALAMGAIGKDPTNIGGYSLIRPLADYEKTVWQGVNGAIWALIALDSGDYEIPETEDPAKQATRERYVNFILSSQHPDGGWGMDEESDVDMTAMAIYALAKYQQDQTVMDAILRGIGYFCVVQMFGLNEETAESCAQMLTALSVLGTDPNGEIFLRNGMGVYEQLLRFAKEDGSFSHTLGGESDLMATEQAFYAMIAYERYQKGETSVFRFEKKEAKEPSYRAISLPLLQLFFFLGVCP